VIDKLEVRLPAKAEYTREFSELYRELRSDPKQGVFHEGRLYLAEGDLRPYGYDVILHAHCKYGKEGNHKLELLETGGMTFSGMVREIEKIFDVNPFVLDVMRVDLAADVDGVPVAWFHQRLRARYKQWAAKIGDMQITKTGITDDGQLYSEMGKRELQTFYLGKRPNCYRIYDKTAEYHVQYQKFLRKVSGDAEVPSFEELYRIAADQVRTRVERQCAGGRVPLRISSVGRLRHCAEFNPFERLELEAGKSAAPPSPDDSRYFATYCAGMWLREQADQMGMHWLRAFVAKHTGRNAGRFFEQYRDFLPSGAGITSQELFGHYQQSVSRQLAH